MADKTYVESTGYHWCNRFISLILLLIILSLFIAQAYSMYVWTFRDKERSVSANKIPIATAKWKKYCHVFTVLTLLSWIVMGANYVFNVWGSYGESASCEVVEIFSVFSYHICKLFLYIVLLLRIKVAFSESVYYQFIIKVIYLLYVLLVLYFLVITIGDFGFIHGAMVYTAPNMFYCKLLPMPAWGVLTFLGFDTIISIICCAAFIYPLKKLMKVTSDSSENQKTYTELIRKYSILTTSAVVSTFVFVFINAALGIGFFVLLDNVINAFCILLMSSWYEKWYHHVCCCCVRTVETVEILSSSPRSTDRTNTYPTGPETGADPDNLEI